MAAKWKNRYPDEVEGATQRVQDNLKQLISSRHISVAQVERELGWTRGLLAQKLRDDYRMSLQDLFAVLWVFTDDKQDLFDVMGEFLALTFPETMVSLLEKSPRALTASLMASQVRDIGRAKD